MVGTLVAFRAYVLMKGTYLEIWIVPLPKSVISPQQYYGWLCCSVLVAINTNPIFDNVSSFSGLDFIALSKAV